MRTVEVQEPLIGRPKSKGTIYWVMVTLMVFSVGFVGGRVSANQSEVALAETEVGPPQWPKANSVTGPSSPSSFGSVRSAPPKFRQVVQQAQQQNLQKKIRTCGDFCAVNGYSKLAFRQHLECKDIPPDNKCTLIFCCKPPQPPKPVLHIPQPFFACLPFAEEQSTAIMVFNMAGESICGFNEGISPAQAGLLIAERDGKYSSTGYFILKDDSNTERITTKSSVLPGTAEEPKLYTYVSITTTSTTQDVFSVPFAAPTLVGKCRDFCKAMGFPIKDYMKGVLCATIKPDGCTRQKCCDQIKLPSRLE